MLPLMKKHILVISQYFYPEQFRINDICTEWVKRGYKVTVVTGIPNYPQGSYFEGYGIFKKRKETYNGIEIIRLPLIPRKKSSIFLAANYASFVFSGYLWKVLTKIKADIVFTFEVSPMTQALLGVWYSKKFKVPSILYVQDLWPENLKIVGGVNNPIIIKNIKKMVDYIYKNTNLILATSPSFKDHIEKNTTNINRVSYWPQYAEEFENNLHPIENDVSIPKDDVFNIVFAGNVGYAQGLEILPKAALLLKETNTKVRFNIIGDGRYKEELINITKKENIENYFNFIDRQPAGRIPKFLTDSDVAFLSFAENELFNKTIPAKLQTYLASAVPILGSVSGESKRIILQAECGIVSPPGDVELLVKNIKEVLEYDNLKLKQMAENSQKYGKKYFDKNRLLDEMDIYIQELLGGETCLKTKRY